MNFNSGKIKWVAAENKFNIDQEYQKIVQTEEKKMESDPDKYMTDIANQKKREKENFKRIADSLAKAKVDEEIRRVSGLKKEQEGAKRLKQSIKLVNIEQPVEYHTDTVPDVPITSIIFPKEKEEPVKITPISAPIAVQPEFDVADTYSLNSEKSKQRTIQKKMERKKSANFALKYETSNELTSLLDAIDEHDKKEKNNK